jgi:putative SOS response-associated peptidase YedK
MCGRFALFSPRATVMQAFPAVTAVLAEPRYNISPTQSVALIRHDAGSALIMDTCRWGLVPFWAKDPSIGNRMINARAETLAEKPAYRQSFSRRRCLILADGFYEWQQNGSGKVPYFIGRSDHRPFGMAGLWDEWTKGSGEPLRSCTVITVPANDFMQPIHHRMPVLMDWSVGSQWLDATLPSEHLMHLLLSNAQPELCAWPVSREVNNPLHEGAQLIEPATAA